MDKKFLNKIIRGDYMDAITIKISCSSDFCDELRKEGLFFTTIAEILDIDREDIIELDD